jgi:hypothetical protein
MFGIFSWKWFMNFFISAAAAFAGVWGYFAAFGTT